MSSPRWTAKLLRRLAPPGRAEDVLGDLEEGHRRRIQHRNRWIAEILTRLEALDMAFALLRGRVGRRSPPNYTAGSETSLVGGRRRGPGVSWLDFKLGFRMLVKYPGLTVIGGLAMAFAIWVGIGTFELTTQLIYPTLPLEDGDRLVGIELWNAAESEEEREALHEFVAWREDLRSVEDIGAFREVERNLITGDGVGEPVDVAEMTASGFRVAGAAPLLGRTLLPADEAAGAPAVVVLGHDLWSRRFEADPEVVGRIVRLGRERATVVGVMPEGFAFPIAHRIWMPLRLNALDYERGQGPAIRVFGRLAPGMSLEEAQAELTALGRRTAAAFPETHEHLLPRVLPYAKALTGPPVWVSLGLLSVNGFIVALLVLVCGNVALLLFARAATREREIVVRHALGASRGRIIGQLFVEALVLSAVAAAAALAVTRVGLRWGMSIVESTLLGGGPFPFWFRDTLSPGSVVYTVVLTLLAAAVAGVLPALKMTGRDLVGRLRQGSAGSGGARFGGVWTAVIVTQVAFTMFCPLFSVALQRDTAEIRNEDLGFAVEEYLSVQLRMDPEQAQVIADDSVPAEFEARVLATVLELKRRLEAEPDVAGVTFAATPPATSHGWRRIEVDQGGAAAPWEPPGYRVRVASVAFDYFDVLGTPITSGRGFGSVDVEAGRAVVVNRFFVDRVLGGRSPIGRRVRYLPDEPDAPRSPDDAREPWYEIVGVVDGPPMNDGTSSILVEGLYHAVTPMAAGANRMVVHLRGDPASSAPRLRRLAAEVDATLRLVQLRTLEQIRGDSLRFYGFWAWLTGGLTLVALVLSWAGIYAVLSFNVARRTREIGIRVALGGDARRIILAIFRRPLAQVGLGVGVGVGMISLLLLVTSEPGQWPTAWEVAQLGAYAAVMMGVCMLACIVPAVRALRVEPTEALKGDA